jgi:hypothetical protein
MAVQPKAIVRAMPRSYKAGIAAAILLSFASLGVSGAAMVMALTSPQKVRALLGWEQVNAVDEASVRKPQKTAMGVSVVERNQPQAEAKGGLAFTVIAKTKAAEEPAASEQAAVEPLPEPDVSAPVEAAAATEPLPVPEGVPVLLVKDAGTGSKITSFKPVVTAGDAEECLNIGYALVNSAQLPADALDVLVANPQITIAKLCAGNGTIVFTCRNNQIAISPRRARPDDACVRS